MFGRGRHPHKRTASSSTTASVATMNAPAAAASPPPPVPPSKATASPPETTQAAAVVSPLQMTFDFELPRSPGSSSLPSPFSPVSPSSAPPTSPPSDASAPRSPTARKSHGGLQLMPHIPAAAARTNPPHAWRTMAGQAQDAAGDTEDSAGRSAVGDSSVARGRPSEGGSTSFLTRSKSVLSARLSSTFEAHTHMDDAHEPMPLSRIPLSGTLDERPKTAHGNSVTPRMEASLFPKRPDMPSLPQTPPATMPSMNRSFIDSRDKPYSPLASPFTAQGNHSSPNLLPPPGGKAAVPVTTGPTPIYSNRMFSPRPSLPDGTQHSTYSGSTARPSTRASSKTLASASPVTTIGTPYGSMADSFPLPQHVKTRPKTAGVISSVAGVTVPTHHTSSMKPSAKPSKSELRKSEVPKKKGRLLNPILLLQRRRSSQDPEAVEAERATREAQAQALARQRHVLASGVNIPPPDFDPRIKGKVVHDFSAPREKRNTFIEANDAHSAMPWSSSYHDQPTSPAYPPRHASLVNQPPPDANRRSTHTPVFRENLDEDPEWSKRVSSIQAENLENKQFLQRVSKHSHAAAQSQESAVLPPFARRSQMLDPMQASHYQDDDSKRSSGTPARNSSSLDVGEISPVTAQSPGHDPISPVSEGPGSPSVSRPVSHVNPSLAPAPHANARRSYQADNQRGHDADGAPRRVPIAAGGRRSDPAAASPATDTATDNRAGSALVQVPGAIAHGTLSAPTQDAKAAEASHDAPSRPPPEVPSRASSADRVGSLAHDEPTKFVEKRRSAAGHTKRSSAVPRKHASNASRFSFQFGESAAQEQALEEKHRKIASREITQSVIRGGSPDEDEDDYFDEDAMDDMDELEMQGPSEDLPHPMLHPQQKLGDGKTVNAGTSQSSLYLQQARQVLRQPESDDGSIYDEDEIPHVTDERDIPYADHPAFRAHSAMVGDSRHNSMIADGYWRDSTIDSYMRDSYYTQSNASLPTFNISPGQTGGYAQDYLSAIDRESRQFSRPHSTLNVPGQAPRPQSSSSLQRPALPHRDSGDSERNRAISGFSFSTIGATPCSERPDPMNDEVRQHGAPNAMSDSATGVEMALPRSSLYPQKPAASSKPDLAEQHAEDATTSFDKRGGHAATEQSRDTGHAGRAVSDENRFSFAADDTLESSADIDRNMGDGAARAPRNESISASSFASPSRSGLSNQSIGSTQSSEDYTRGGFAGAASPTTPRDGHIDHIGFTPINPPLGKSDGNLQHDGKGDMFPMATGLGLSNFADFDFGQGLSDLPHDTAIVDASDFEDEHAGRRVSRGSLSGPVRADLSEESRQTSNMMRAVLAMGQDEPSGALANSKVDSPSIPAPHRSPRQHVQCSPSQTRYQAPEVTSPLSGTSTRPMPFASRAGANLFPAKPSPQPDNHQKNSAYNDQEDDMYFDDGNIGVDFGEAVSTEGGFDEDAFDDDNFLYRPNAAVNAPQGYAHRRQASDVALTAGDDACGPYPSFTISNAQKALARNSLLAFEDMSIQAPVDPKFIPQRNPSEDARRQMSGGGAPPAPMSQGGAEALMHMRDSLQKYHAALADAANRAAAAGRFDRQPSIASTVASSMHQPEFSVPRLAIDTQSLRDDMSVYSQNEDGGPIQVPYSDAKSASKHPDSKSSIPAYGQTQRINSFDFGFDQGGISDFDNYDQDDDDLVAAANAEVLASDVEGFYGQEFHFYGRPRANSNELEPVIGGYFGPDGDDGLQRNKSLKEPNLTPITERSEFSTRNSFVAGMAGFGPQSPALSRMPITPLMEHDVTSFDDLRRLRAQAFGGGSRSERSTSNRSSQQSLGMMGSMADGNVGHAVSHGHLGSSPMQYGYSTGSSTSSNTSNAKPPPLDTGFNFHESPHSATSSNGNSFALDIVATPKRSTNPAAEPVTARKAPPKMMSPTSPGSSHSRKGSAADSINYVRESSPDSGRHRWVLERRRTSEQDGQLELVGRELIQGGWI